MEIPGRREGGPHPPRTPAQIPRHRTPSPRTSPRRTYPPPGPGQPHTSSHREGALRARKRRSGTPRTPWRASERDPVHTGRATETRTPRRNPATGKTPTEADPPEPFTRERVPRAPHRTRPPHEPTMPCRRGPSSTHHRRHDDPTDEDPRQRGCACARARIPRPQADDPALPQRPLRDQARPRGHHARPPSAHRTPVSTLPRRGRAAPARAISLWTNAARRSDRRERTRSASGPSASGRRGLGEPLEDPGRPAQGPWNTKTPSPQAFPHRR